MPMSSVRDLDLGPLPAIDERLVMPGTRYEIDDGKLVYVPPARETHGELHAKLATLLSLHAAPDFRVLIDVLMRTSHDTDIAPDASVLPRAPDPITGGRQIDQLTFEIATSQSLGFVARRARKFRARGVRRVFAIHIAKNPLRNRVYEWSVARDAWEPMGSDAVIDDPALAIPLPVRPLLDAAALDDSMSSVFAARRRAAMTERHAAVLRRMIITKFGTIDATHEARLATATDDELDGFADRILGASTVSAVFDGE